MQITYELSEKDFVEAYKVHRSRSLSRWFSRILVAATLLLFLIVVVDFLGKPTLAEAKSLLPLAGIVVMWVVILFWFPSWNMRRQFHKQPGAHGTRTLHLDSSGAHWRWDGGSSDVEWKNYIRSVEGKDLVLFYTSPACFNILPKRSLDTEQVTQLSDLLKQNIRAAR